MGLDCSKIDDWTYEPVNESPAAYVADMRKRMQMNPMVVIMEEDQVNTEDMTADELREYYDNLG